jgi:hypothetical protein
MKTIFEALKEQYGKYPLKVNKMKVNKHCGVCEEPIRKGEYYYDGAKEWAHEECVNPNII